MTSDRTVRTVVVPAAGLGTRLLSATKEQPKEMLPIFARDDDGDLCMKPMLQLIFEYLYDFGFRNFCFVVGREKRAIECHFTPDRHLLGRFTARGVGRRVEQLKSFYTKIETSNIMWVNQPDPNGFGDAVRRAERAVSEEPFFVHAGDTLVFSDDSGLVARMTRAHIAYKANATLCTKLVADPRQYGVAETLGKGSEGLDVHRVLEKPKRPRSRLAIMPLYVFDSSIFEAIKCTKPGEGGEIQLTDAIQQLIDTGHRVRAIKLGRKDVRLDIGRPETYWKALQWTYHHASK